MPTSSDIRQQFIDFFVERCGHTFVPSSPVVPHDDPTLLFANAGMNQFKDVFLGVGNRPYVRAVNTQKCIRAGGKHNDLDDVGKDTYHHTFFEMLGNWSLGDYFKAEAIRWAWELLTEVWGLEKDRMYITVFAGDEADGVPADDEAANLWTQVTDVDPSHISRWDKHDNFWEMADTGPCGPNSEIHYDATPDKSGAGLVNADDPRVIEIWNLVFIQFNRAADGTLHPLPAKHVDTGMGFERIVRFMQGKTSNYDTDVFTPLFAAIRELTGAREYRSELDDPIEMAYRVIADHIRTLAFAITDGAMPGNEGRGYVLRRILRRAVRHGRQTLGVTDPFLHRLVPVVTDTMGAAFPELRQNPDTPDEVIREEEVLFGQTLDRGIDLFQIAMVKAFGDAYSQSIDGGQVIEADSDSFVIEGADGHRRRLHIDAVRDAVGTPVISGNNAFMLYNTYGFPLDLTQIMAEERGMEVDVAGFEKEMAQHRDISRAAAGRADARDSLVALMQQADLPATDFVGYDHMQTDDARPEQVLIEQNREYQVAEELTAGQPAALVVARTPFYAEAGGQVGDVGSIHSPHGAVFQVDDTIKLGDVYFHLGQLESGTYRRGEPAFADDDALIMHVDAPRRRRIMIHHTATHIMNWAMRKVLGDHVQQKGSLVDQDRTRFDLSHAKAVSVEQIGQIERLVNEKIAEDLPVHYAEAPQEEALKINGLRAVFGEKYPPMVRVVSIGVPVADLLADPDNAQWPDHSVEFCGGTHLVHTGEAKQFVIVAEEAVAKGIRRITAVAGDPAASVIATGQDLIGQLDKARQLEADDLEQAVANLTDAMNERQLPLTVRARLREGLGQLQSQIKKRRKQQAKQTMGDVAEAAKKIAGAGSGPVIVSALDDADGQALRTAMDIIRKKQPDAALLLGSVSSGKVAFIAAVPDALIDKGLRAGDWVREVAKVTGGGGGGRPDMAQAGGKDPGKLNDALEVARTFAEQKLG